jgi:hypothetical protein
MGFKPNDNTVNYSISVVWKELRIFEKKTLTLCSVLRSKSCHPKRLFIYVHLFKTEEYCISIIV